IMGAINYIWDEENDSLLEEVDDDGNIIASYTNEPGPFGKVISQERNGVTSYYHYDGQGNTVALTDDNENVTDAYIYSAYGELVSSTGTTVNPFRYGGQYGYYTDVETNDIYIRARSYAPTLGRWLTRDPIGFIGSPYDLYEFNGSSPPNSIDPEGLHDNPACARRALYDPKPDKAFEEFKKCMKSLCCPMAKCKNCDEQAGQLANELLAWYKDKFPLPPDRCQKFMTGVTMITGSQKFPCIMVEQFFVENKWPLPTHTGLTMWVDGCATIKKVDLGVFGVPKCGPV
ncbi:MAG TPA: RHS repeat-associated core domain-containing protein, partial [Pirellula sp.]|nr:RHS repeat-associated core domain-containing protein [Pirellula sp.]